MLNIDVNKVAQAVVQWIALGILGFGVKYLHGIDTGLSELKEEFRTQVDKQNDINKEIMYKMLTHETRIRSIERKVIR